MQWQTHRKGELDWRVQKELLNRVYDSMFHSVRLPNVILMTGRTNRNAATSGYTKGIASQPIGAGRLTYRCVQEHDKRLDWLVKAPDWLLMDLMEHSECPWRLLAIRAGYVKLGLLGKY